MILFLLAYLGGVLTIVSPCILPVLPFVFARADRPFLRSGLPLLLGMAAAFAAVATLAAVGGGWAVRVNDYGRIAALVLLALFGVTLLVPAIADRLMQPLVALGGRLSASAERNEAAGEAAILPSLLLGVATGLLWAPCAGPILGLILTGAALQGASVHTSLLLLTYAAGAATCLAVALLAGRRVFAAMKRSLGAGVMIRRALGVVVLASVAVIAAGLDTSVLTSVSLAGTTALEQRLIDRLRPAPPAMAARTEPAAPSVVGGAGPAMMMMAAGAHPGAPKPPSAEALPVEGTLPSLAGAVQWLNSPPLTAEGLRGKVVLVDFWTYSCINCLRTLPYVEAWAAKYRDAGLVVIGVHAPEFAFERDIGNVRSAVARLHIDYPVAIDNDYAIWRGFNNEYWPAHYFIDAQGRIRHHHFGEGNYAESERVIQQLLAEAKGAPVAATLVSVTGTGAEAAPDMMEVLSPETYVGYARAANFASPGGAVQDRPATYDTGALNLNQWGLTGAWTVGKESAVLDHAGGGVTFRFHARDLHLVLGPGADGKPVRFRVTIDGAPPGDSHGSDTDAAGNGVVDGQRLYQLVRQAGAVDDHTFAITFLDPGVEAYSFTFG